VSPSFPERALGPLYGRVRELLPERVLIGLAPSSLACVRIEGGLRPRIAEKRAVDCDAQSGAEPWRGAVAALAGLAASLKDRRSSVSVVLSNHFVRYALVPRSEGLDRDAENLAFARYCFGKIHGERSKGWEVRLSESESGSARIAGAIDAELLQAIGACFPAGGKARLASVQPYLMSAFNQWRAIVGSGPAWMLLVEPQRACLAHLENGRWDAVRNTRGEFEGPEQWAELLDRERHLVAAAARAEILVHAPHRARTEEVQAGNWRFKSLSFQAPGGFSPVEDARLAMALSAR
jgi:hypothetical protein